MKPEPNEIDRIMATVIHESEDWQTPPEKCTQCLGLAASIRAALKASGYAIVLDEAQLLERGREVKIHD